MPSSPLASAESLPPAAQLVLWSRGSIGTRVDIAKRSDLAPEVEVLVASSGDATILEAYLRNSKRASDYLDLVAVGPLSEGPAQLLAVQRCATGAMLDMLIDRQWPSVASVILLRDDLTAEQRARAAVTYVRGRVRVGWSDTQSLMDRVGSDAQAWVAALDANLLGGSAVPLAAAVTCGNSPEVQEAVVSWWEANPVSAGTDADSDRIRSLARLLTSPTLEPAIAERIAALTADSAIVARAHALARMEVRHWLDQARDGIASPEAIMGLADAQSMTVDVVATDLIVAYYRNPLALTGEQDDSLSRLARTLAPKAAGEILDDLVAAGRSTEALSLLARLSSYVPLETMNNPIPLIEQLSIRGDKALLRSSAASEYAAVTARHYRPLCSALTLPAVGAHVTAQLVDLLGSDPALLETAIALADEWQGSLGELMSAARALTHGGTRGPSQ